MTAAALRALLAADRVTHLPGVYDPPTATLATRAGHRAAHLSGAACAALDLGLPDLGYVHGTHIADRAARIVPALGGAPLLADADTGYGDALQAVWTARRYAAAGIAGLHLEDQVQPKRCGHLAGKELIGVAAAARKVRAVVGDGTGIVVVARTDAYSVNGLADAIDRARAYFAAGADAVFLEGVSDLDELARAHAALPGVPLVLNRSEAAGPPTAPPRPSAGDDSASRGPSAGDDSAPRGPSAGDDSAPRGPSAGNYSWRRTCAAGSPTCPTSSCASAT
ncbi:isocitrate lyase/PEP mutase family protein, partial [Catellatospora sp. NPDC049609]|uniref:isocitrate lyase/PEP mutase family protein n=1 Tax=Catellatospora sp. NPDC049609 TaxID=3155505 RepID=UPI0034449213